MEFAQLATISGDHDLAAFVGDAGAEVDDVVGGRFAACSARATPSFRSAPSKNPSFRYKVTLMY
jgi:hypothetical protein